MNDQYPKMKLTIYAYALDKLTVEDQYELAKKLAANCGYQLVAEDTERSLEIKELIKQYNITDCNRLIIEGLEALLK